MPSGGARGGAQQPRYTTTAKVFPPLRPDGPSGRPKVPVASQRRCPHCVLFCSDQQHGETRTSGPRSTPAPVAVSPSAPTERCRSPRSPMPALDTWRQKQRPPAPTRGRSRSPTARHPTRAPARSRHQDWTEAISAGTETKGLYALKSHRGTPIRPMPRTMPSTTPSFGGAR